MRTARANAESNVAYLFHLRLGLERPELLKLRCMIRAHAGRLHGRGNGAISPNSVAMISRDCTDRELA